MFLQVRGQCFCTLDLFLKYDKILPPAVRFLVVSSIFNIQRVENRNGVVNVVMRPLDIRLQMLMITNDFNAL